MDYLAKISPEFQKTVGVNSAVDWPVGIGGKGNEGVSGILSRSRTPGAGAYPMSSFTWLLLYTDPPEKTQARAMNAFVKWALTDGQEYAADLHFAPLPPSLVARELMALETIKTN